MADPTGRDERARLRFTWLPGELKIVKLVPRKRRKKAKVKAKATKKQENNIALSEERAAQILMEETVARRPRTPDTSDEEREYRKGIRKDVAKMKAAGIEIVVPTTQPG